MIKKEIFRFLGSLVLVLIVNILIHGSEALKFDSVHTLNKYDTYYVVSNIHFTLIIAIPIFFVVYLLSAISVKFKNMVVNAILIIATILLILNLVGLMGSTIY